LKAEEAEEVSMTIVFIPSLAALLIRAERQKGSLLTQQEVEEVRDNATCVFVPDDIARHLEPSRGYSDIDPLNCWEQWASYRAVNLT